MNNLVHQVMIQDLTSQIANITSDRSAWRARALVAEQRLQELAEAESEESDGDDMNTEDKDE